MAKSGRLPSSIREHSPAAAYACLLPMLTEVAHAHGYALAVHGSMRRDLDLVCVPWVEDAASGDDLVAALNARVAWLVGDDTEPVDGPTTQPHGRRSWAILLFGGLYLDVSVMPRREDG